MTKTTPRRRTMLAGAALIGIVSVPAVALGVDALSSADQGASTPGSAKVPAGYSGINDPKLQDCMQAKQVCNPTAYKPGALSSADAGTMAVSSPAAAEAIAIRSIGASDLAPAAAIQMTGSKAQSATGEQRNAGIEESRQVWVVTVHAKTVTDGSPARAGLSQEYYSAIIDAGTGIVTDDCIGCAWLPTP